MYKKQKIIKSTISIIIVITIIVLGVIYEYNHRFYDKGRRNIFEIPDTVSIVSSNVNKEELVIVNNYIIQDIPSDTLKMEKMIYEFVTNENILQPLYDEYKQRDIGWIELIFRRPSWKLPVYWNGPAEDIADYSEELLVKYRFHLSFETDPYTNQEYISTSAKAIFYVDLFMNRTTSVTYYAEKDLGAYGQLTV